jgi:hypothetical protein
MDKKRTVFITVTPLFMCVMFMGFTGLSKGIDTHNALRIAAAAIGMLGMAGLYFFLVRSMVSNDETQINEK